MDRRFGKSSVIREALYRPERKELDLLFTSGRRYIYSNVPIEIAIAFRDSESKGRYYNGSVRNCFPCREVGGPPQRRAA